MNFGDRTLKVMMLGDSITEHPDGRKFLYDKLLEGGYAFEFVGSRGDKDVPGSLHEGRGGYTIGPDTSEPGNLFDHVDVWIPAAKPDIIMLLVGNNDYNGKPGVDPATAPERMTALLEKIHSLAPDAIIVVSSVLKIAWVDDYAGAFNRALPGIVEKQQALGRRVYFADLHNEVDLAKGEPPYDKPGGDFRDGTHPGPSGSKKLGAGWFAHLARYLSKRV